MSIDSRLIREHTPRAKNMPVSVVMLLSLSIASILLEAKVALFQQLCITISSDIAYS